MTPVEFQDLLERSFRGISTDYSAVLSKVTVRGSFWQFIVEGVFDRQDLTLRFLQKPRKNVRKTVTLLETPLENPTPEEIQDFIDSVQMDLRGVIALLSSVIA